MATTKSEAAALKEAERPEDRAVNRDVLLDALVKSEKKVTTLEDVLNLVLWAAAEYEGSDNPAECVTYLLGVKDAYEAIHGPIIR